MPLIKPGRDKFPPDSEIESISMYRIDEEVKIKLNSPKAAIFVKTGTINLVFNDKKYFLSAGQSHYITNTYEMNIKGESDIILVQGKWENDIGSSGFFSIKNSDNPHNSGDPVDYNHYTVFDNHYHDFDEVWVILEGSGTAYSEGIKYEFEKGDCVFTMMGYHHDLPYVKDEVLGIYFETSLKGKKRPGHLWKHTHGLPHYSGGEL